jgi:hypothetical protein
MAARLTHASDTLSQVYERSKDVLGSVADETNELYHDARTWVPEHYGQVAILSSAAVGVCLLGYLVGRRSRTTPATQSRTRPLQEMGAQAVNIPEFDITPFFKFLKLWMLYRVATRD